MQQNPIELRPAACRSWASGALTAGLLGTLVAGCGGTSDLSKPDLDSIPPSALRVDSTVDTVDASPGDGICADAIGECSLRAAIMEANASRTDAEGQPFTIFVPAGEYRLTRANPLSTAMLGIDAVPDRPLASLEGSGSLLITAPMTLIGAGARDTIVDAAGLDRVFEIGRAADSALTDMMITGGAGNTLGGGVYAQAAVRLERVAIVGNQASGGGGIFINPIGSLELIDSTVSHNESQNQAGGIRIDSNGVIINSTISHNRANGDDSPLPLGAGPAPLLGKGGGIDVRGRDVTIVNSTIAFNSADAGGAGLHFAFAYIDALPDLVTGLAPGTLGEVRVLNTIIANNESLAPDNDCMLTVASSRLVTLGGNLDSDGSCFLGSTIDHARRDPMLLPLNDNGGPTDTHALKAGSPAIDTAVATGCMAKDQRGTPRPQGAGCDIGAFERD